MERLPYDKQYELTYQIYDALCAQYPDWWRSPTPEPYSRNALRRR